MMTIENFGQVTRGFVTSGRPNNLFFCWLFAALLWCGAGGAVVGQERNPTAVSAPVAGGVPGKATLPPARAAEFLPAEIWPGDIRFAKLSLIGRGKGIVFSPDLSVPTNRRFYEKLGFAYFEGADWRTILWRIKTHNQSRSPDKIEVLILETHGTNGHGLKLQTGHGARAPRSYLSIGALQENLSGTGIRLCVITACNAGRLFRPAIYKSLNTRPGDPLFLPATMGVVNASPRYDPSRSEMRIVYPAKSQLETTNEGDTSELSSAAQVIIADREARPNRSMAGGRSGSSHFRFIVSDMLIQMLLHDPRLRLNADGYVTRKSDGNFTNRESEDLFLRFLDYVDEVARRESQPSH